jgi:hypothetical protein
MLSAPTQFYLKDRERLLVFGICGSELAAHLRRQRGFRQGNANLELSDASYAAFIISLSRTRLS